MDAVTLEQDLNSQIGSTLCLAAGIEAAPAPDVELLRKSLPRLGKLLKSEGFKAKAALLVLVGSVVGVGGASSRGVLDWLVPCVVEFLSVEDWAVRKASAEALGKVAVVERDFAAEYKDSCLNSLESRRFDKVDTKMDSVWLLRNYGKREKWNFSHIRERGTQIIEVIGLIDLLKSRTRKQNQQRTLNLSFEKKNVFSSTC